MVKTENQKCNLERLRDILLMLPSEPTPKTIEQNRLLVAEIGSPPVIQSIIQEVLADERTLESIASHSYRHVNHFDKIVLIGNEDPSAYRLTLHLWCPPYTDAQVCDELIHDHRFSFWSTVLTGTLIAENFEQSELGKTFRQYRYIPEQRSQSFSDFYEFHGEIKLSKTTIQRTASGVAYYLAAPSIHRIVLPQQGITCTLVLRGPRLKSYSTVYNTGFPSTNTQIDNVMFTSLELSTRLSLLLQSLANKNDGQQSYK